MKMLPFGISNYEELVEKNCYYVDKTKYIKKLEGLNNSRIMFLRPRRFGKTLFTSVLENYYDINKKDKFEELFGETYIGKNPTPLKNSYYILHFNFAGINTSSYENTIESFKKKTFSAIISFMDKYKIEDENNIIDLKFNANDILNDFFRVFKKHKENEKLYVIIDEYDQFANELLGYDTTNFKNMLMKNGFVRNWYEILKEGCESVVDRIFITGVAPITLDSLTSGFNIASNITLDEFFNEMMGFTEKELIQIMDSQELSKESQEYLLPIMKEYYNGYKFSRYSETKIYNSTMCLYFLDYYLKHKRLPDKMTDVNVDSDSSKIENMLNLCRDRERFEVIRKSLIEEEVRTEITEKFNPMKQATINDMFSLLFYLGYLTIESTDGAKDILAIPNKVMRGLYQEYYYNLLDSEVDNELTNRQEDIYKEISNEGKIEKLTKEIHELLHKLSNRDYINFDEKNIKFAYNLILTEINEFEIMSELEVNRQYMDLLILPKNTTKDYYSILIEFKYLKKSEENLLKETKAKAKEQILEYSKLEKIKSIQKLKKYTVVAVVDELYVDEI